MKFLLFFFLSSCSSYFNSYATRIHVHAHNDNAYCKPFCVVQRLQEDRRESKKKKQIKKKCWRHVVHFIPYAFLWLSPFVILAFIYKVAAAVSVISVAHLMCDRRKHWIEWHFLIFCFVYFVFRRCLRYRVQSKRSEKSWSRCCIEKVSAFPQIWFSFDRFENLFFIFRKMHTFVSDWMCCAYVS